jgi:hypothetical protein
MSNPSTIDQIKASAVRLVSSGISRRLKIVDATSDGKIIDASDIAGNAGVLPSPVSFSTASAGDTACVASGDHVHAMPVCSANSFVGNATDVSAMCAQIPVPASSILGRTATGTFRAITKVANRVLAWNASGDLYQMQVEPGMMAGIAPNSTLANATSASASPTALAISVQSVVIRAAGNIISQAIAASSVLGRTATGDLGSVKVSPDMQQRIQVQLSISASGVTGYVCPISILDSDGAWAAISANKITIPVTGRYAFRFSMGVYWGSYTAGTVWGGIEVFRNNATTGWATGNKRLSAAAADAVPVRDYWEADLTAGDLVDFRVTSAQTLTSDPGTSNRVYIEKKSD